MQIAQIDTQGNLIAPPCSVGVSPEISAADMKWPPGTWREITPEEAEELQKPSRADEIIAEIAALEAKQTPRLMGDALLGNPDDVAMLRDIRGRIAALRAELAGPAS